jgi:hypothetical protein
MRKKSEIQQSGMVQAKDMRMFMVETQKKCGYHRSVGYSPRVSRRV